MKNIIKTLKEKGGLLVFLLALLLVSCTKKQESGKQFIAVSIEPQRYFAEKIVGDKFEVRTVVTPGSSPEYFDPTPAQIVDFGKSKVYFMIGLFPFEQNLSAVLRENNPNVMLVNCSKNIASIALVNKGESHYHGLDPHIWSSPENAKIMSKKMLDEIVRIDPVNKALYDQNYTNLLHEINATDSLVRQKLKTAITRDFIIYHPALTYFAKEYGLTQYAVEHEGKSSSPVHLSELVDLAKQKGVKTIFVQPEFDKKNAEILSKEIGGRVVSINPLAYDWKTEMLKIAEALEKQ